MEKALNKHFVSIIIANFNGEKYLPRCLDSVIKSKYKNIEIIIVDDGSKDLSRTIIDRYVQVDDRIKLLKNAVNLGASASRNKAITYSQGDILVFLDNDTEVDPDWIDKLLIILQDPSVGAAQSLLLDFENRALIQMAGGKLISELGWLLPLHQMKDFKVSKDMLSSYDIVGISAALAVKKDVITIVEGFDELEAVTTEDLDFCWRIWIAGFKVQLCPDSIVYHYSKPPNARAYLKNLEEIYFHLAKNSYRSIIKNYTWLNIMRNLPISILVNVGRGVIFAITQKNTAAIKGSFRAIVWNINNMPNTLLQRKSTQLSRKCSDAEIYRFAMHHGSIFSVVKNLYEKKS